MNQSKPVVYRLAIQDALHLPSPGKLADWMCSLTPPEFNAVAMISCSESWCANVTQRMGQSEVVQSPPSRSSEDWCVAFRVNQRDDLAYALSQELDQQERRRLVIEWSALLCPAEEDWRALLNSWNHELEQMCKPWWVPQLTSAWSTLWLKFVCGRPASLFYHDAFNDDFWVFANSTHADVLDQNLRHACQIFKIAYYRKRWWDLCGI